MFDSLTKAKIKTEKQILLIKILKELELISIPNNVILKSKEKFDSDIRFSNPPYRDRNELFYQLGYVDCISDINKALSKYVEGNK